MSLQYLLQKYDAIGVYDKYMVIDLDQDFTGSAELIKIMEDVFQTSLIDLTCLSWERSTNNDFLKLYGTSSLLNIDDSEVTFIATTNQDELLVTIGIRVPSEWKFSTSFEDLPERVNANEASQENRFKSTILDEISWGACNLVFTNQAHYSEEYKADLVPGLNFVGELFFMGALMNLQTFTGAEGPVMVSGPIQEYQASPDLFKFLGIRLTGEIPKGEVDLPFELNNQRIYIKNRLYDEQNDPDTGIFKGDGIFIAGETVLLDNPVTIMGKYSQDDQDLRFDFYATFQDASLGGLSSLGSVMGGDDVSENLPENLTVEEGQQGLALEYVGFTVNLTSKSLEYVTAGVSYPVNWTIVEEKIILEKVGLGVGVFNPFNSKTRRFGLTLSGLIGIGGSNLALYASYPDYSVYGGLPGGETMPLGDIIQEFYPSVGEIPEMTITQFSFYASPKDKNFSLQLRMEDLLSYPIGKTNFEISAIGLNGSYDKQQGMKGAFLAEFTLGEATALISGSMNKGIDFATTLRDLNLKTFWAQVMEEELPEELPEIIFEELAVTFNSSSKEFGLKGTTKVNWEQLPGEGSKLDTTCEFNFNRTGTGSTQKMVVKLSLQGTGPAEIAQDFTLGNFNFLFEYQTNSGWKLGGGGTATLFDEEIYLQASYEKLNSKQVFKLTAKATPEIDLIRVKGLGGLTFSQLDITSDRRPAEGGKNVVYWDVRINSSLELDNLFELGGYMNAYSREDGSKGLVFNPNKEDATLKIDFPGGDNSALSIGVFQIGMLKEKGQTSWAFNAMVDCSFSGMPGWLDEVLPKKLRATLTASKDKVSIGARELTDPIHISLGKAGSQSLGDLVVQIVEVGIEIRPVIGLSLEVGLGFPSELNAALGSKMFREYTEGNLLSLSRTKLTVSRTQFDLQFLTSPFMGANAVSISGESWIDIDLGESGAMRMKMPTLKYDALTQYFEAGGGVEITRPLSIPLTFLKNMFNSMDLEEVGKIIPSKLPLDKVHLVDENGNFNTDDLIKFLEKGGSIPNEIKDVITGTGDLLERFPDTFKQYLHIDVPEKLEFKFGFSPAGRYTMGLKTGETPVRILYPAMIPGAITMPGLVGIELRELSFTTLISGGLFFLHIDGHTDSYDLGTLALSLALPTDEGFPLPTSDELQRRLIFENLYMVIPLSAGVPIPLPIFYDRIGMESMGLEGVGIQTHLSLPAPDLGGATTLLSTLKEFFSDPKVRLDPDHAPGGFDLVLDVGNNNLRLPEYLGGKVLGTEGKSVEVSAWKGIASGMNFLKFLSINDLIQSIPINQRVGSAETKFGFMKFDADWMLTTPQEFRDGAFKKMKLSDSDKQDFLDVLPTVSTESKGAQNEEGIIAFVRGEADLAILKLEAVFGLAASRSMGFTTGFKFSGEIAKMIEVELKGVVAVNTPVIDSGGKLIMPQPTYNGLEVADLPAGTPLALNFDGENTWVRIPDSDSLALDKYTLEVWVKPTGDPTGNWAGIAGKPGRNYCIFIHQNGFVHHRFKTEDKNNDGISNTPNGAIKWNEWNHVAIVNNGKTAVTYVNGEALVREETKAMIVERNPLFFGCNLDGAGNKNTMFRGQMGEIRLWKGARTATEIQTEMYSKLDGTEKNLVSCWRFQTGYGDTAVDICGRNHGVIYNPSWIQADRIQLDGLRFDGSKASAVVSNCPELQQTGDQTIEFWVKPVENPGRSVLVGKAYGGEGGISLEPDGSLNYYYGKAGKNSKPYQGIKSNGAIKNGEWSHIAVVRDVEAKMIYWYINGKNTFSRKMDLEPVAKSNMPLTLADGWCGKFNGQIDELRLWNRARSAAEINSDRFKKLKGTEKGLAAYWPFEEGHGSFAPDKVNGLQAALKGAEWGAREEVENAISLTGLTFNGSSSAVITSGNKLIPDQDFTLQLWVKTSSEDESGTLINFNGMNAANPLKGIVTHGLGLANSKNLTLYVNGNSAASGINLQDGRWHHLAVSWTSKTGEALFYLDGDQTKKVNLAKGNMLPTMMCTFSLGQDLDSRGQVNSKQAFGGTLAEVRIFEGVQTAETIRETMHKPLDVKKSGIRAWWPLDEGGGSIAQEKVQGADGVISDPVWNDPFHLQPLGLTFDGKDDYVILPNSDAQQESVYSVETWIRPETISKTVCILSKEDSVHNLWLNKYGQIEYHDGDKVVRSSHKVDWEVWNHIALTDDGKKCSLYVNGQLSETATRSVKFSKGKEPLLLAKNGKGNHFKGSIDEVRLWKSARSTDDIQSNMFRTMQGNENDLVACWSMSKGSGTYISDRTGYSAPGTISGAAWTLVQAPQQVENAAIQVLGHTHLAMLGHRIFQGDIRLVDDTFWFKGDLTLFPSSWPVSVNGTMEGLIQKDKFYLSGNALVAIGSVKLASAKAIISDEYIMVDGRFLGAYLKMYLSQENKQLLLEGSVGFDWSTDIDFGEIKIGGVKVSENIRISLDIGASLNIKIRDGKFSGSIKAHFKINGVGFDITLAVNNIPTDAAALLEMIKDELIKKPMEYIGSMFSDAAEWLKNVASGAIKWAEGAVNDTAKALKNAFKETAEGATKLLKAAGIDTNSIGGALKDVFKQSGETAAKTLKAAGETAEKIGGALKDVFSQDPQTMVKTMGKIGHSTEEAAKALGSAFKHTGEDAARVLSSAGKSMNEVGNALSKVFKVNTESQAKIFKNMGKSSEQIAGMLKSGLGKSAKDVSKALSSVGFSTDDLGKALKNTFKLNAEDAAKTLKDIGKPAEEVGKLLKNTFKLNADDSKKILKDSLKFSDDAVKGILKGAGYAAKEVEGMFEDAGKSIAKFFGF
ncbi:MAG: hypothetical protein H6581_07560 [Bacteroidia bacterium]|nr:hypothetical protein [Bacteroidia bacterium]